MDLNTQKAPDDVGSEEAQRAKQLRDDAVAVFQGFGGLKSNWFVLMVCFPELGTLPQCA